MGLLSRIFSIIVTTFMIAIIYGLFCVTVDVLGNHYDPVQSGRKAAGNIYGLFGTVTEEAKRNDAATKPSANALNTAQKIAAPYAVTADVSAILGGKMEIAIANLAGKAERKTQTTAPAAAPAPTTTPAK